jgi:hypothetical protein
MHHTSARGARRATALLALTLTASLTIAAAPGVTALAAQTSAGSAKAAAGKKTPTPFSFSARAYGSRLKGGQVPVKSDSTAYQSLGCTNLAGIDKRNFTAHSDVEGVALARGVRTRTWTTVKDGVTSSNAMNQIANVQASQPDLGALKITRLRTVSKAYHDKTGFHATTEVTVGDITYRGSDGATQDLDPPELNQPVEIPGVLKISIGDATHRSSATGASAAADGLTVRFIPTNTTVILAHSGAKIGTGVKQGLFFGRAVGTETRADDPLLRMGAQPLLKMPCLGTGGEIHRKSTAAAGDDASLGTYDVTTRQSGSSTSTSATGFEEAAVSTVSIGGGQIQLTGIVGRVNVTRTKTGLQRDIQGTTIGSVTVGGQAFALPDLDGFTIPGLVRIDTNITTELKDGIEVVALRLTFLDGSNRVTDLGHAKLQIVGTGLK